MSGLRIRLAGVALLSVSLAACGSRADFSVLKDSGSSSTVTDGGADQTSAPTDAPTAATTGGGTSGGTTASTTGTTGGTDTTSSTGGSTGGASGTSGSTGSTGKTSGVKAPIKLVYIVQGTAGVSAITGSSVSGSSDAGPRVMSALVSYANAHGGVGGRLISATGVTSQATSQETDRLALCKHITEDLHAQVLLDQNQYLKEDGWSCFAQHHVDYFGTVTATSRAYLAQNAPFVNTTWLSLDRSMKAMAAGAKQVGFFKGGKVGVLLTDDPVYHRLYDSTLKPALAAAGVTNPQVRYVGGTDAASQQSATSSAELAFSSAGVNRIVFLHNILVYLSFTNTAKSQGYHPLYEFSDVNGMTGVAAFYGTPDQNKDALAISSSASFVPDDASHSSTDTTAKYDRKTVSPGTRRCLDILTKATGKDYYDPQASGDNLATWVYYCDEFFAWWEAAQVQGAGFSTAKLGPGLSSLGKGYLSTLQNSTDWSNGAHDAASTYRVGKYNVSCTCFPKVSGWIPI